nr:RHS repeat-associated core domain-containing protein [uncultured Marinifilum sp.]
MFTEEGYYELNTATKTKKSDYGTYYYTLKDHLGHTRVIVDEEENVIQETAYYPYGGIIAGLSSKTKFNYLYTGKEFIDSLGVFACPDFFREYDHHARYYDPEIGRWFAIDPALQAASPYMAMGNNPMMMVDEDGEFAIFAALAVGALIGAGSYTASIAFSKGGFDNWNWGGFFQSAGLGAVSGVATGGIGEIFGGLGGSVVNGVSTNSLGTQILNETGRALAHGVAQGGLGAIQGDNFFNGFASGGLGSIAGSGFQTFGGDFAKSIEGGTAFSAVSGGIGAELSGGNFWRGAGQGATVALLNHYMKPLQQRLERPSKVNLKKNPVRGLKRWMRYINRYKGVDPTTGRTFNLSDMVNASTVPKRFWFWEMYGNQTDISGVANGVQWQIKDSSISPSSTNNITRIGTPSRETKYSPMIIRAYRFQTIGVFSLMFSDYSTYLNYCNYIGIEPKYEMP